MKDVKDLPAPRHPFSEASASLGLEPTARREGLAGYATLLNGEQSVVIFRGDSPGLPGPVTTQEFVDAFGPCENVFTAMADGWYNRPRSVPVEVVGSSGVPFWRAAHPAAPSDLQPVARDHGHPDR